LPRRLRKRDGAKNDRGHLRHVVVATAAHAEPLTPAQEVIAFGIGGRSCGNWTQWRQSKSVNADLSAQWVAGFLSGKNQSTSFNPQDDPLRGADFAGLMAWIDNYCGSHPLESIHAAANMLMDELRARAQRQR
jgi:hypothetical protein